MRTLSLGLHFRFEEMKPTCEELTAADVRALAASIYEPQPRCWIGDRWRCPQCMLRNPQEDSQCACGISRDGLPEFCER